MEQKDTGKKAFGAFSFYADPRLIKQAHQLNLNVSSVCREALKIRIDYERRRIAEGRERAL